MYDAFDSKNSAWGAFFASLMLYVSLVGGLALYLASTQEWVQRFSTQKDSFLDVTLVERPKQQQQSTRPQQPSPQPNPPASTPPKPTPGPSQAKPSPAPTQNNVRDLFRGIDTAKLAEPKPIPTPPAKTQSRAQPTQAQQSAPSNAASKLVGSLALEEASSPSSARGAYDPFLGAITELLEGYWQQTIDTVSGAEATVRVTIDRQGRFSYSIVRVSYNNAFNAKLRDFLERMRSVSFPPYTEGEAVSLNVNFKDIME